MTSKMPRRGNQPIPTSCDEVDLGQEVQRLDEERSGR